MRRWKSTVCYAVPIWDSELAVGFPGARAGPPRGMETSQFEQGHTASVFLGGSPVPSYNFCRAFAPDDAVPQRIVGSLVGGYICVKRGSGNFHSSRPYVAVFSPRYGRVQSRYCKGWLPSIIRLEC